jgi:hypothetical protein
MRGVVLPRSDANLRNERGVSAGPSLRGAGQLVIAGLVGSLPIRSHGPRGARVHPPGHHERRNGGWWELHLARERDVRRPELHGHVCVPPGHMRLLRPVLQSRSHLSRLPLLSWRDRPDQRGVRNGAVRVSMNILGGPDAGPCFPRRTVLPQGLLCLALLSCGARSQPFIDDGTGATPGGALAQDGAAPEASSVAPGTTSAPGAQPPPPIGSSSPPPSAPGGSTSTARDASVTCAPAGGSASGSGDGNCDVEWSIKCGDTTYQVACACPRGSCVCFGPTTTIVAYPGCPVCPDLGPGSSTRLAEAFSRCGFPYPE